MTKPVKDEQALYKKVYDAFKSSGYVIDEKTGKIVKVKLKDFIEKYDSPIWLSKAINTIVRETIEPELKIKNLFKRVNTDPGVQVTFIKTMSAVDIGSLDVADGQDYPTLKLDQGTGGYVTVQTQKSGIQFIITDTMKQSSQYDIIQMHIQQATQVLARHLEKKALNLLLSLGTTTHDNLNPGSSIHGTTTGRDAFGTPNGTLAVDDLVEAYSDLMLAGFQPDLIIISPLTWAMWMKDPVLRYFAIATQNPGAWYNMPAAMDVQPFYEGGMGPTGFNTPGNEPNSGKDLFPGTNLEPKIPSYFPFPITVMTSHFMPVRIDVPSGKKLTDVIIADSRYIGVNVVEEDVMVDQNIDWFRESTIVRIKTKQGFAILEEGKAIGVIRNVVISDNSFFVNTMIQPSMDIPNTGLSINRNTPITLT